MARMEGARVLRRPAGAQADVLTLLCCPHPVEVINVYPFKDAGSRDPHQFVLEVKNPRILRISPSRLKAPNLN